jgi:ATP-dependent exoDNAse (exonuclease V) alpha subunit
MIIHNIDSAFIIRAATVHKSQGTTLTRAELMMSNAFDFGQTYVALSRVKSLDGLWLTKPLVKESIKANPKVLQFYGYNVGKGQVFTFKSSRPKNT